ncbi:hypothetical protein CDL15_Pgr009130 [Punica granatum]|uniref:Uncharacterized protein n=1 Tax=Punica granatum TaxID=22663 RepID=A0A218WM73_PUNGR|nr:hypothetical protein CDL15_Pgr009130 [Punica granatum]
MLRGCMRWGRNHCDSSITELVCTAIDVVAECFVACQLIVMSLSAWSAILKISPRILAVVLGIRQTCIHQRKAPFGVHILVLAYRTMGANSGCQSYSTAIMKMCKEV